MKEHKIDKASSFRAVRARLLALAYRMLGSRAEAEDIVQDVWLKWHLADTHAVQTPAAWLTTLTTRTAIDRLRNVQRERESQATGWLPEPWLDEFAPSAEELALRAAEMSYGVMLLLDRLKPDERAAFVLHEAFDCDYAEIGKILERPPASCRQLVHRARERVRRAGAPLQRRDPGAHALIVERLRNALQAQDRTSLLELFSAVPEVVSDQPSCESPATVARASEAVPAIAESHSNRVPAKALAEAGASAPDLAFQDWMEKVTSLARQARQAELVSVDGMLSIALLVEGEVVALIDVSIEGSGAALTGGDRCGTKTGKTRKTVKTVGRGERIPKVAPGSTRSAMTSEPSPGLATGFSTSLATSQTTGLTHAEALDQEPPYGHTEGLAKIVSLRWVTSASRLQAANRLLGRAAVTELLSRIQQRSLDSTAMGRDFPVDVYA
ncbi:sigma-70 family RNA polymerase sigma factor [bacterium M00.F.Ca.ET.228.01.1.1]|uniref:sigma-70 family RNA polymerase sigma factor n=1 Tax=Paraburkholderia phenoliruptrix TaxID=252970 RepID=UPI001091FFCB|nr:sigma-70 family RNA polymerase sigma factor [Paraburkholderia phenoliruptrix]TGP44011.1 sigma-70 family RNA polymerase sigma factor [bacterium M00.F.Ca.ET.228.01.1.1]TGS01674.1 sigma-70 family RNA polymerase sigma factor [bacterium M00.F.Ca.ET.191.01.1.1]TGU08721.1 sigma-70 family RNA polymerase sigma factor [bacterium M00.F.Ca.ET.155.01.1.1]MBW0450359.1 sigma-70 family RNA polymerase sigma factor [Paraburkholderia phenoliruptrix]MBW9097320.1 sigma-70 family RNA polymerase sigma factor [Par